MKLWFGMIICRPIYQITRFVQENLICIWWKWHLKNIIPRKWIIWHQLYHIYVIYIWYNIYSDIYCISIIFILSSFLFFFCWFPSIQTLNSPPSTSCLLIKYRLHRWVKTCLSKLSLFHLIRWSPIPSISLQMTKCCYCLWISNTPLCIYAIFSLFIDLLIET
jgi:hypothetical protein